MARWLSEKKLPLDALKRVDALLEEGKLDEAHELTHELLEAQPHAELHRKLYEISEKRNVPEEAAEHLKAYLSQTRSPEMSKLLRLAELLMEAGQVSKARKELEGILDRQPGLPEAQALVARTFRLEGDLQQAMLRVERLVTREPECWAARKEHGYCRMAARDHEGAFKELAKLVGHFRDDVEFLEALGQCAFSTGRYRPAKRALKRVLKLDPKRAKSRYYLGCVRLELGNKRRGLQHLEEAAEHLPETEELLHRLYGAALDVEDPEKAYRYFLRYSSLKGKNAQVWKEAAERFLEHGARQQAADAFRHAYHMASEDAACACRWLELQMELGDRADTVRFLEDAVANHPKVMDLQLMLVRVYLEGGELEKARERVGKAAMIDAKDPRLEELRGRIEDAASGTTQPGEGAPD